MGMKLAYAESVNLTKCQEILDTWENEEMKILIVSRFAQHNAIATGPLPRVGDKVDMFYSPLPTVEQVILWPRPETLDNLTTDYEGIDALVFVR